MIIAVSEYDDDTGQHRIYDEARGGELICCVGNITMGFDRQEALTELIRSALCKGTKAAGTAKE